jgi:phosphoglycerate dehydrogenase-like enzyme
MAEENKTSDSSPIPASKLRLIYIAGIGLNVIALTAAASAGELLVALTFGIVIVYLCLRYWLLGR